MAILDKNSFFFPDSDCFYLIFPQNSVCFFITLITLTAGRTTGPEQSQQLTQKGKKHWSHNSTPLNELETCDIPVVRQLFLTTEPPCGQ